MPVIIALKKLRQEDLELESSLDYMVRLCLKKQRDRREDWPGETLDLATVRSQRKGTND